MQIGVITVDGTPVGTVSMQSGNLADPFVPDLDGYEPMGRADRSAPAPGATSTDDHAGQGHRRRHGGEGPSPGKRSAPTTHHDHEMAPRPDAPRRAPRGELYRPDDHPPLRREGSAETDRAIVEASRAHGLDPNTMRGIASIESSMNPSSNANARTQYKGLYQIGREEWRRFGQGNIYSARDNAMAAARMFEANRSQFRGHFGRDPTDTELYLMHQQGLGFYTRGAMTNIGGNRPPGTSGPYTHESFEAGWGRQLARRKAGFAAAEPKTAAKPFDPETDPL